MLRAHTSRPCRKAEKTYVEFLVVHYRHFLAAVNISHICYSCQVSGAALWIRNLAGNTSLLLEIDSISGRGTAPMVSDCTLPLARQIVLSVVAAESCENRQCLLKSLVPSYPSSFLPDKFPHPSLPATPSPPCRSNSEEVLLSLQVALLTPSNNFCASLVVTLSGLVMYGSPAAAISLEPSYLDTRLRADPE